MALSVFLNLARNTRELHTTFLRSRLYTDGFGVGFLLAKKNFYFAFVEF